MKFTLDYQLQLGDHLVDSATAAEQVVSHAEDLKDIGGVEGHLSLVFDGEDRADDFTDPIIRLVNAWVRKLPWIIGGDTETVALRNSEQCFAFVPTGESVEITYFTGTEAEIEDYIIEPVTVRLDQFVAESIAVGDRLLALWQGSLGSRVEGDEDLHDLVTSLSEAKRAWHEYQLHPRR